MQSGLKQVFDAPADFAPLHLCKEAPEIQGEESEM